MAKESSSTGDNKLKQPLKDEIESLRAENERLRMQVDRHGSVLEDLTGVVATLREEIDWLSSLQLPSGTGTGGHGNTSGESGARTQDGILDMTRKRGKLGMVDPYVIDKMDDQMLERFRNSLKETMYEVSKSSSRNYNGWRNQIQAFSMAYGLGMRFVIDEDKKWNDRDHAATRAVRQDPTHPLKDRMQAFADDAAIDANRPFEWSALTRHYFFLSLAEMADYVGL
ncbi:hypothetical protein AOQ84DRAFT_392405 [Glonium stellatum]|uniref:Uncharacterized protein n=1 Tax=Glonium stellatum TaxID=574774 RepID=A0A8E2EQW7_9PEZI|nr:hypothetical protein AOQ84DRAFT_392405 [Glonium stellatum]